MPFRDLTQWNLNLLFALNALLEEESVSRAAKRLSLTQPAMSRALQQLRDLLDDPLLVRSGNKMLLTPKALALRPALHRSLNELQLILKAPHHFDPQRDQRTFRIATSDASAVTLLTALSQTLHQIAPQCDLHILQLDYERYPDALEKGEIDLAIGGRLDMPHELKQEHLFSTELIGLACRQHPALQKGLTLELYAALPHVLISPTGRGYGPVDDALAKHGLSRRIALRLRFFLAAPFFLVHSPYILTSPRRIAERFCQFFPLSLHPLPFSLPPTQIHMLWHLRDDNEPALSWLREQISLAARSL
jgi:DNA-binding transcriptional LysR family regulator